MKRLDPTKISSKMQLEMLRIYIEMKVRALHGRSDRELGQLSAFQEIARVMARLETSRKGK